MQTNFARRGSPCEMTPNRFLNVLVQLRQILGLRCNSSTLGIIPRGDQYARFYITFDLKGQRIHWNARCSLHSITDPKSRSITSWFQLPTLRLLNHFLELRAEHIDSSAHQVATERDVEPVALLAFNDEVARAQIWRIWFISSGLCNHIDKQVPAP